MDVFCLIIVTTFSLSFSFFQYLDDQRGSGEKAMRASSIFFSTTKRERESVANTAKEHGPLSTPDFIVSFLRRAFPLFCYTLLFDPTLFPLQSYERKTRREREKKKRYQRKRERWSGLLNKQTNKKEEINNILMDLVECKSVLVQAHLRFAFTRRILQIQCAIDGVIG